MEGKAKSNLNGSRYLKIIKIESQEHFIYKKNPHGQTQQL